MVKSKAENTLSYLRIVIKFGTSLLTGSSDYLDRQVMADLVRQVAGLHRQGREIIVVSSGAIASGRSRLGLAKKVKGIPYKQVCFSVGQSRLMNVYEQLFDSHGITVAQGLLTKSEISGRTVI